MVEHVNNTPKNTTLYEHNMSGKRCQKLLAAHATDSVQDVVIYGKIVETFHKRDVYRRIHPVSIST